MTPGEVLPVADLKEQQEICKQLAFGNPFSCSGSIRHAREAPSTGDCHSSSSISPGIIYQGQPLHCDNDDSVELSALYFGMPPERLVALLDGILAALSFHLARHAVWRAEARIIEMEAKLSEIPEDDEDA
eukprot:scaffold28396_cov36-Prasinocladus_malaysianus.AAC.1